MIQTFIFRKEGGDQTHQHTVRAFDIKSAVERWLHKIVDLQDAVHSFIPAEVANIWQQFSSNQLKIHIDKAPYFLAYYDGRKYQVVHIYSVDRGIPDFLGRVTYLNTSVGGRNGYVACGYRGQLRFDGKDNLTSGEQLFLEKDKVFPGETAIAEIRLLRKDYFKNHLFVGQHFEVSECRHLVAIGEILEVLNLTLVNID